MIPINPVFCCDSLCSRGDGKRDFINIARLEAFALTVSSLLKPLPVGIAATKASLEDCHYMIRVQRRERGTYYKPRENNHRSFTKTDGVDDHNRGFIELGPGDFDTLAMRTIGDMIPPQPIDFGFVEVNGVWMEWSCLNKGHAGWI